MPHSVGDSVSQWIAGLKAGDPAAASKLWRRYYKRLVGLARRKLRAAPRRAADEEDVVQTAFASFCRRARQQRFPDLHDRHDLWHLVVKITARKAVDQVRGESRKKRGAGRVRGDSLLDRPESSDSPAGFDGLPGPDPTPEFIATMTEVVDGLLGVLDDNLRAVALLKLDGFTNEEIAARIDRSLATVERRLKLIRQLWNKDRP